MSTRPAFTPPSPATCNLIGYITAPRISGLGADCNLLGYTVRCAPAAATVDCNLIGYSLGGEGEETTR